MAKVNWKAQSGKGTQAQRKINFVPVCLCAFLVFCFLSSVFVLLMVEAGCESAAVLSCVSKNGGGVIRYAPAKINILPLTEFIGIGEAEETSKIKVYVSLLDSFNCQIKTPGAFRFELYQHIPRSAEPKGRRIAIWPDVVLTDAVENNNYWRDFLRAYGFNLDFEPQGQQNYILQATFLCPSGRRLSAEIALKYPK